MISGLTAQTREQRLAQGGLTTSSQVTAPSRPRERRSLERRLDGCADTIFEARHDWERKLPRWF